MSKTMQKSKLQERRITRNLNKIGETAKKQVASGSKWNLKSDVVSEMFQIEAKTKVKPSKQITIRKEWFDKIEREAFQDKRIPVVVFSFGDSKDYYCLSENDFLFLVESLHELRRRVNEESSVGGV